jgi:hypothetical protein
MAQRPRGYAILCDPLSTPDGYVRADKVQALVDALEIIRKTPRSDAAYGIIQVTAKHALAAFTDGESA